MSADREPLARIAAALERLVPAAPAATDWHTAPAYVWDGAARAVPALQAPPLDLLRGIDSQKQIVTANVARLAQDHAAHDMLLWGARGMGKSALIRSAVCAAQDRDPASLALVQVVPTALASIAALFTALADSARRYLVFIDDLGFEDGDGSGPRALRSWLEGGVEARPHNVRLAVTANRRAIVPRHLSEQDDPVNPRDALDDRLALADRFGLSIGFHACSQEDYLAIVAGYCTAHRVAFDQGEALEWAKRRGARSGRTAWQFVTELAGRAGLCL
jgi:uncharacterized protein